MKKYSINFTTDFSKRYEQTSLADEGLLERLKKKSDFCNKWKGKEISLNELEELIDEFGEVVFNGESIEIVNDYRM